MTVENAINVRRDYAAFLRAKVTPGVRYEGEYAILPDWVQASRADRISEAAPHLHDYQQFAVAFAVAREKAALFLECGLGKTSIALAWVEHVRAGCPAMICAPLAALHEFENEREKFFPGAPLRLLATADVDAWLAAPEGIGLVTHHAFVRERDLSGVSAFVLDESSILKSAAGAIAQNVSRAVRPIAHRLALSATPAPNDPTEYAQHAVFLGHMRSDAEFRARFFVRDGKDWRVKGHAKEALPKWLSRFALWMRDPSVYGMPCAALPVGDPELREVEVGAVDTGINGERDLFGAPVGAMTMSDRARVRSALFADDERTRRVVELCRGLPTIVWATRNEHADRLERAIRADGMRVAQIAGTTPDEDRVEIVRKFQCGELDVIVSKAKCIGHGVNLQRAERMVLAGYDESYEALHQMVRRAWRQGRTGPLDVRVMVAPEDRPTVVALRAKGERWKDDSGKQEREFAAALAADLAAYRQGITMTVDAETLERLPEVRTEHYWLQNGDSIALMKEMDPESVDISIFSPPFASLYTYSSNPEDMGNCSDQAKEEFNLHFAHFCDSLHRVMKPGRVVAMHLAQIVAFRARHGRKGIRDFRGDVIRLMEEAGFHYYGEFVIPKNPQAVAIRTKSERLQFSQLKRDSLESSPALNDYVLEFRKPGKQAVPVMTDLSNEEWIRLASGVWDHIVETDVLSYHAARGEEDEKHICPLQLRVYRDCLRLWSNPGEVLLEPFGGIGSGPHEAILLGRQAWAIELKQEYFRQMVTNCERAVAEAHGQLRLAGVA